MRVLALLFIASVPPLGCGSGNNGAQPCTPTGFLFVAGPASGTNAAPDHSAKPPGNQEQFNAGVGAEYGPGCDTPQVLALTDVTWTVSDTANVQISSAQNASNGLATCMGATQGAATVTATYTQGNFTETRTSTISCK